MEIHYKKRAHIISVDILVNPIHKACSLPSAVTAFEYCISSGYQLMEQLHYYIR